MERRIQCLTGFVLVMLVLFGASGAYAVSGTYSSRLIQQMENYDYASFLAAEGYVQAYDAAVIAMDASVASGDFFHSLQEAQKGYTSVCALTQRGQQAHEIILLYMLADKAWQVTADTKNFELQIELVHDAGQPLDDAQSISLAQSISMGAQQVDSGYFWQYFMYIFVTLTGEPIEEESQGVSGGGAGEPQWDNKMNLLDDARSMRIDLSVRMEITEEMTDFVFRVNGSEIIEAHANPNSNLVTGRYIATRNGLYVFELGYKIRGEEILKEVEVSISEIVEEPHEHAFEFRVIDVHPHVEYVCDCGESGEIPVPQGPGVKPLFENVSCCLCGYHEWGMYVRHEDGTYSVYCQRENCDAVRAYTLNQGEALAETILEFESDPDRRYEYLRADGTTGKATYWRGVAAQAVGKLSENGFVIATELLNTYSDVTGSLAKAAGISSRERDLDALQVGVWEGLIVDLLTGQEEADAQGGVFETVGGAVGGAADIGKVTVKVDEAWDDWGQLLDDTWMGEKIEDISDDFSEYTGIKIEFDPDEKSENGNKMQMFGYCVNVLSSISDGLDAADEAKALFADFEKILRDYERNIPILDEIISAAQQSGNALLEEAAVNVKTKLQTQTAEKIDYVLCVAGEGMKATGASSLAWGTEEFVDEVAKRIVPGADDVLATLGVLEDIASVGNVVLNWSDAYATAQDLMTLQDMSNSLDICQVVSQTQSSYVAELWTGLQIVGVEKAKEFLKNYEAGLGLDVEQLGIDDLDAMYGRMDDAIDEYEDFLEQLREIRESY